MIARTRTKRPLQVTPETSLRVHHRLSLSGRAVFHILFGAAVFCRPSWRITRMRPRAKAPPATRPSKEVATWQTQEWPPGRCAELRARRTLASRRALLFTYFSQLPRPVLIAGRAFPSHRARPSLTPAPRAFADPLRSLNRLSVARGPGRCGARDPWCSGHRLGAGALDALGRHGGYAGSDRDRGGHPPSHPGQGGPPGGRGGQPGRDSTLLLVVQHGPDSLTFPVRVAPLVMRLDWPYLIGVTLLATLFFARGRVGRVEGLLLVGLYGAYIVLHVALR